MTEPFKPTHRISERARRILVKEIDGVCYTRAELETCSTADWEIDNGRLIFQGVHIPHARIRQLNTTVSPSLSSSN